MKFMLSCQEATRLSSDRLDASLTPAQRWPLALHLFICRHCRRFDRDLRRLHQCVRNADGGHVFLSLPPQRKAAILQRLEQEAQA